MMFYRKSVITRHLRSVLMAQPLAHLCCAKCGDNAFPLVSSEYQDLLEEIYCLQIRLIISYNNKSSNNPYFPLTSSITI